VSLINRIFQAIGIKKYYLVSYFYSTPTDNGFGNLTLILPLGGSIDGSTLDSKVREFCQKTIKELVGVVVVSITKLP
jgi:hypothetical protein